MKVVKQEEEERTSALLRLGSAPRGRAFLRLGTVVRGASRPWRSPRRGARISRGTGRGYGSPQYRGQQSFRGGRGWRGRGASGYVRFDAEQDTTYYRGVYLLSGICFVAVMAVHQLAALTLLTSRYEAKKLLQLLYQTFFILKIIIGTHKSFFDKIGIKSHQSYLFSLKDVFIIPR